MTIEIMLNDLKADVQSYILSKLGLSSPEEGNLDIVPLATIEIEDCLN